MGYRVFGTIYSVAPGRLLGAHARKRRLLARHFVYHSSGRRCFKFRLTCMDADELDADTGLESRSTSA
jgi:hypothetical protein